MSIKKTLLQDVIIEELQEKYRLSFKKAKEIAETVTIPLQQLKDKKEK